MAFKQPVRQGEIDRLFGNVDKRHLVFVLREAGMIEEFGGEDKRLRFATLDSRARVSCRWRLKKRRRMRAPLGRARWASCPINQRNLLLLWDQASLR